VRVVGQAAVDLLRTFVDRWKAHPLGKDVGLKGSRFPEGGASFGNVTVQVTHTYGRGYPFPGAVRTAADQQLKLVQSAKKYIYYEDQYLIGTPEVQNALDNQLKSRKDVVVIGVMSSSLVADVFGVDDIRNDFWSELRQLYQDRVLLFTMCDDAGQLNGPASYLHNKMTIVDDIVATVGTVNFNNRSWTHDSEVLLTFGGSGGTVPVTWSGRVDGQINDNIVLKTRLMRWARHLDVSAETIVDWKVALTCWRKGQTNKVTRWEQPYTPTNQVYFTALRNFYQKVLDPP